MKKNLYIIIGIIGLLLGIASAFIPVKIIAAFFIGVVAIVFLLADYQRVAYVVALYPILYFISNRVLNIPLLANAWDELLLVFCILVLVYKWFFNRKEKAYEWTPLEFPLLIFFAIGFFLLFIIPSSDFRLGLDGLRAIIEYMVFFFIVVQLLRNRSGARRFACVMVFSGAYMGFVGIYQYFARVETPAGWTDKVEGASVTRVFSIIGNPNALGTLLVLLIPLAISLILTEKGFLKKGIFSICAVSMALCLVFTGSRSSWIAFACAILVYAILNEDKRIMIGIVLVAVLVASLAYSFVPSVQGRISYMLNPEFITSSFKGGRFMRWPKAFEMFKQNLWFGVGLGKFGGSVASINKVPGTFYVDNYYLKTAVEMGIFGLTTFMLLLYNALAWSLRALRKVRDNFSKNIIQSSIAGMCGVLVTNVPLNNFDAPAVVTYFWIVAGLVMYLGYVNREIVEV